LFNNNNSFLMRSIVIESKFRPMTNSFLPLGDRKLIKTNYRSVNLLIVIFLWAGSANLSCFLFKTVSFVSNISHQFPSAHLQVLSTSSPTKCCHLGKWKPCKWRWYRSQGSKQPLVESLLVYHTLVDAHVKLDTTYHFP